jgi:hypothetical protein
VVLDAHRPPVQDRVVLAHVAGRVDAGRRGLERRRAPHATALTELEAGLAGEHDVGRRADRDQRRAARDLQARRADQALDAVRAREALDLLAGVDLDAVLAQHLADHRGDLRAERQRQRALLGEDERRADAHRRQRRGDLARDERAADDADPAGALGVGAQRVGVAQGAQEVDAVEVAALERQAPHVRPGRDQRVAVGDRPLRRQPRLVGRGVELHDARAREDLDVAGHLDQRVLLRRAAQEVVLGDRGALVRRVELAPDEEHRSAEALGAQLAGRRGARDAAADEQDVDRSVGHG